MNAAPLLWATISELTLAGDLLIDATDLTFIDSTGVGCLLKLHHRVRDGGGMVILTGCQPSVRRTLETTGLNRLFAVIERPG